MSSAVSAGVQSMPEVRSLYEIILLPSSQTQLQDYFQKAMTILSRYFSLPYSALLLRDPKREMLQVEALYGMAREAHPLTCPQRKGIMGEVIDSQQPMALLTLNQEPLYEEMAKGTKKTERIQPPLLCVPLVTGGESLGVMSISSLFGDGDGFSKDFQFLSVLSAVLSPAIRSFQTKKDEPAAGSSKSKLKLEDLLEGKLTEVLNRIDPYVESKAKLGFLDDIVCVVEKILIKAAMEKVGHVQISAAQLLGINRNTLRKKIKDLKIKF
jgi:transcriptional regulator with GAF, ATPase, and Fis domain